MLIAWMKLETLWMFTYPEWTIISTAMGCSEGLEMPFFPVVPTILIITSVAYIGKMFKAK